jgi:inner membrane protein
MPTLFGHIAVPLAVGAGLGKKVIPKRLLIAGMIGPVLPDLDVIAFTFGIPYASIWGHRGVSHSMMFALVIALLSIFAFRTFRASRQKTFWFLFSVTLSHTLLDALTNGGLGVALLWPLSEARFFAPWRVIQVSPIGGHFFSLKGLIAVYSEVIWVWLPCSIVGVVLFLGRKKEI